MCLVCLLNCLVSYSCLILVPFSVGVGAGLKGRDVTGTRWRERFVSRPRALAVCRLAIEQKPSL